MKGPRTGTAQDRPTECEYSLERDNPKMSVLLRRYVSCIPPACRWHTAALRHIHQEVPTPFDIDETDEKYKELNSMYVDMFTGTTPETKQVDPSKRQDPTSNVTKQMSEIDELNEELEELYNIRSINGPLTTSLNSKVSLSGQELEEVVKSRGKFVLQSRSHNPFFNLAVEDYVFRNTPLDDPSAAKYGAARNGFFNKRLMFYINDKTVVIGKNQTVWQEVYMSELKKRGYNLVRRLSGGGAVVHDLGNVNYSFLTSRKEFDIRYFNSVLVKWLLAYNPDSPVEQNKRCDILWSGKKCSGSAFKIARGKAYHHGTMLVDSSLQDFSGLLKPKDEVGVKWDSSSVDSVRSNITNIGLLSPQRFVDLCTSAFQREFATTSNEQIPVYYCDENATLNEDISGTMETLMSDEWRFMSGPKFKVYFERGDLSISVEKGYIVDSNMQHLIGIPFREFADDQEFLKLVHEGDF